MSLSDDGYEILRGAFLSEELDAYEAALLALYRMQATKCGYPVGDSGFERIYGAMEDHGDIAALYEVQKLMPSVPEVAMFAAQFPLPPDWLSNPTALIEGPGLFINRPGVDRLLYRWHSEAHYYPKRRRFLNLWWPLFGDKHAGNGTMSVMPGSHLREWPFAEYDGDRPGHFVQYEVPESLLGDYEEIHIEAARGDLVIFDRNLIHRSNPNLSDRISVAGVARVWDPTDDLTLSGTMAATPYGGDVGRAGLVVS